MLNSYTIITQPIFATIPIFRKTLMLSHISKTIFEPACTLFGATTFPNFVSGKQIFQHIVSQHQLGPSSLDNISDKIIESNHEAGP